MRDRDLSQIASTERHGSAGTELSRFLGLDVGAETIKLVELVGNGELRVSRRAIIEHGKRPGPVLLEALRSWDWGAANAAAVTGRFAGRVRLRRIPPKQAQLAGYHFLFGHEPATLVNIGSHGFSVLELRKNGQTMFRENSRCSQGTGNFLRQLVERFSLTVDEAGLLCSDVTDPAPLSGRCPVILKTDMTHLANKGEDRARILAGLFDAVCENVLVLIKPGLSPAKVLLTGGVSRSPRVRRVFGEALKRMQMELLTLPEEEALCIEALGAAILAGESFSTALPGGTPLAELPALEELLLPARKLKLEGLPPLAASLQKVRRMPGTPMRVIEPVSPPAVIIGLDVGSTGSKLVALEPGTKEVCWEGYRQTLGDPVGAAQDLLRKFSEGPAGACPVIAFGATGSGREVAGSLLTSCYGKERVFIVNEIVAHATGALRYDERVDTIFEIGGQDAKYIRLAEGRIIDCAMNEACSAGTGSFIEEQGRKFSGIEDVRQLGAAALAADAGVSLGQHCSVFMAEVIDEAVATGIQTPAIISGLYDSIIKNYLNRVKGNRPVGKVIFCQGMPFSADALASAVARQTGSEVIVPPNPGTVGALGIALLAARELRGVTSGGAGVSPGLDVNRFLNAKVEQKDSFICRATTGCGGAGNKCRIERLRTMVEETRSLFTWGGGCALHDKATRKRKLPNLAPDPFRDREEILQRFLAPRLERRGNPRVAMADEFMLKGLFPFFAAYFHSAGFDLEIVAGADQSTLKRGIQAANVPFCAPMQLFHGIAETMGETKAQWIFVPMVCSVPPTAGQRCSAVCPIVQAAPDVLSWVLGSKSGTKTGAGNGNGEPSRREGCPTMLAPRIDFGPGALQSKQFRASCREMALTLGLREQQAAAAFEAGLRAQGEFDASCEQSVRRALEFCKAKDIVPVVVLGRGYTIYNKTLNSNVPAILREQGAIAIPVDYFPVEAGTPHLSDMYWGYGEGILRAARQVRRTPGIYALYCSNYSCGPDSFNLHFAAYLMEGKPFAIIETDGHSGDAGTKTRVEAFLHCVEEDRAGAPTGARLNDFETLQFTGVRLHKKGGRNGTVEKMLVPNLGPGSEVVAAAFRGLGFDAEALPSPDLESLRLGRRYTSGKECLPMPITLGALLQRLQRAGAAERFLLVMPSTDGPCRFGVYNSLNQIVLERLGYIDRVRIWSPKDSGYFDELPAGTEMLMLAGILSSDLLVKALLEVRPVEAKKGEAERLYFSYLDRVLKQLERAGKLELGLGAALWQVATGRLFGLSAILDEAGREFSALRQERSMPLVEMTGEIYVRAVDFSNDHLVKKLEERGLRVQLAPQSEWLAYCAYSRRHKNRKWLVDRFSEEVQHRIEAAAMAAIGPHFNWPPFPTVPETLAAARPYVTSCLQGEAVLTVGASLAAWRRRQIDAVVAVGPLECMPTKIAEAQFHHLSEHEGLLSLTLAFNGDPVSTAVIDNFAFEVHARFRKKLHPEAHRVHGDGPKAPSPGRPDLEPVKTSL